MTNVVPIKVKIGLKDNGHAKYPDFNTLQVVKTAQTDWSHYIDIYGSGWLYDSKCGHKEQDITSPLGQQWGVILAPKDFVDEAVSTFPGEVSKITEVECEAFYNDRYAVDIPEEDIDINVLTAIKAKKDLGLALTATDNAALDPTNDTPGIRKSKQKKWTDYKALKAYNIVQ